MYLSDLSSLDNNVQVYRNSQLWCVVYDAKLDLLHIVYENKHLVTYQDWVYVILKKICTTETKIEKKEK